MTGKKKTEFHRIVAEKGWLLENLAARWGIGVRQMSRIANNPKIKDIDAAKGLPKSKDTKM